jgi:predicted ATPase
MFDPERDADLVIRFAQDVGVAIMAYLALALWPLGEVDRARKIADETVARARRGDRETGVADLRQALAAHTETGNKLHVPYFQGLLAELEAEAEGADGALARIDAALAVAAETGERWTDAFLHRIRGEILWKRDPADTAPAEEAFLTAIAVAQQQKARSFELRAALALAKLYQSINRAADAYAVVAPALEGFSPTPEFPEIAEAQTLLAALAATDEVKNAKVSRR